MWHLLYLLRLNELFKGCKEGVIQAVSCGLDLPRAAPSSQLQLEPPENVIRGGAASSVLGIGRDLKTKRK